MKWRSLNMAQIIGLSSLLLGVILLPFGIASQLHDQHFRSIAKQTQSISIEQVPTPHTRGGTTIKFSYLVNGQRYTAQQTGLDYSQHLSNQAVLYNPADPAQAELANSSQTAQGMPLGLAILFIILGVAVLSVSWVWRRITKNRTS